MQLIKIPIEDIYPDDKNPRKDFGDIKALAESFELNTLNPGEPVNPIVVVQDGGIYRIVDGERRYRAMKLNKLSSCSAVVCEDMDEANAQIAMLATNDKQPLSPLEISRGVQQQLLLGVDPVKVEKSARMKSGSADKARRARELVDDAAADMTLDRLYAIAEFEDDPEAVEKLTNCSEREWEYVAKEIREERAEAKAWEELLAACEECGFTERDEDDEDHPRFLGSTSTPEGIAKLIREKDIDECDCAQFRKSSYRVSVDLYGIPREEEIDPAEEAYKQKVEEVQGFIEDAGRSHALFVVSHLDDISSISHVSKELTAEFFDAEKWCSMGSQIKRLAENVGQNISCEANGTLVAYGYTEIKPELGKYIASYLVDGVNPSYSDYCKTFAKYLDWVKVLESDDYTQTVADQILVKLCTQFIESNTEEEVTDDEDQ